MTSLPYCLAPTSLSTRIIVSEAGCSEESRADPLEGCLQESTRDQGTFNWLSRVREVQEVQMEPFPLRMTRWMERKFYSQVAGWNSFHAICTWAA